MSKFKVGDIVKHRHFEKWRAEVRGVGFSGPNNKPRVVARCTVEQHGDVPKKPYDLFFDEDALVLAPKTYKTTLITYKRRDGTGELASSTAWSEERFRRVFTEYIIVDVREIEIELKE